MDLTYDFPKAIDNTMRTAWDACQRKFLLGHIYNLRKGEPSMHLVFGGAYAKGLEVARKEFYGGNTDKANYLGKACIAAIKEWDLQLDDPLLDETKSLPNCLGAILYCFETWPMVDDWLTPLKNADGSPTIEFTFALPISAIHPKSSDPILYTGRFDMFADFQGAQALEDDKTASQLGNSWVNGWDLDSQITGYVWAGQQSGYPNLKTAIIRGVSILKTSFGHAQAIQYRTKWHISNWYNVLHSNLDGMLKAFSKGPEAFTPSYGQACKAYGGCPYRELCDKENWEKWIEPNFHHYVWDPLAISGVKDEQDKN